MVARTLSNKKILDAVLEGKTGKLDLYRIRIWGDDLVPKLSTISPEPIWIVEGRNLLRNRFVKWFLSVWVDSG